MLAGKASEWSADPTRSRERVYGGARHLIDPYLQCHLRQHLVSCRFACHDAFHARGRKHATVLAYLGCSWPATNARTTVVNMAQPRPRAFKAPSLLRVSVSQWAFLLPRAFTTATKGVDPDDQLYPFPQFAATPGG